ncbi:hypothetical protein ACVW00_004383 [Marmoricola sp. URHA0025 HA25]
MTRSLVRTPAAPNAPTIGEILNGDVPTLVVHRSWAHSALLPDLITRAAKSVGTEAGIAAATRLTRQPPAGAQTFMHSVRQAALRIADPEIHTLNGPNQAPHAVPAKSVKTWYPWAKEVPAIPKKKWVGRVLDAQYDAGANVFLSASGWVGTAGVAELDTAMEWVRKSRKELEDEPMFVNLTLHHTWLSNSRFRDYLLAELVENPEKLWWVRVMWPRVTPINYSQLRHADVLAGYRELARTARAEGKVVFLPNSAGTGWLATALGASGFSTGMSGAERAYEDKPPQGGGGGNEERQRYFDRNVLHTTLYPDHRKLLDQPGHTQCTCKYCRTLSPTTWDKKDEQLHYLLSVAELTGELGRDPKKRQAKALKLVQDAKAFVAGLSATAQLFGESAPNHLGNWETLLT